MYKVLIPGSQSENEYIAFTQCPPCWLLVCSYGRSFFHNLRLETWNIYSCISGSDILLKFTLIRKTPSARVTKFDYR